MPSSQSRAVSLDPGATADETLRTHRDRLQLPIEQRARCARTGTARWLDQILARRRKIRERYRTAFAGVAGVSIFGGDDSFDNCWLTSIVVEDSAGWTPAQLCERLEESDIESRPIWKPMHLQPCSVARSACQRQTRSGFSSMG